MKKEKKNRDSGKQNFQNKYFQNKYFQNKYFHGHFMFRCLFRFCMISMIMITSILIYYKLYSLCTLSETLTKNNLLSDFIGFMMLLGCVFFYFGYCHHQDPLSLFRKDVQQPFLYILRLSIIPLVFLLVVVYDIKNYFHFHYILMFCYISITLFLVGYYSFLLAILPFFVIPLLYLGNANLAVYEFLYILYVIIIF